jgi:hypothetical protein
MASVLLLLFVGLGFALVGVSIRYRFTSKPVWFGSKLDEETNDRWRFAFFIGWTLSLPLALLVEIHCPNRFWPEPRHPLTLDFTYARKVISDLWAAVAVVLAALSWNKKPEKAQARNQMDTPSASKATSDAGHRDTAPND